MTTLVAPSTPAAPVTDERGVAVAVNIVHVAHLSRVIEVLDCNQQVIYSEVLLPTFVNDRWFLPSLEVIRRAQALKELYELVEREG